ncbi:RNA polymerase II C-terminal domain kinase beta subunit, partial [Ascosphaera aggregata]
PPPHRATSKHVASSPRRATSVTVARDPTPPPLPLGPHPSFVLVARSYIFAPIIHDCLDYARSDPLREEAVRMQGITWIDNVRKALHLPVRTFNTAAMYFHKYRLTHLTGEYNPSDAAAAALFTACKVEDTLKKSKDILVAAYNLRATAGERITTDDPVIEMQSRSIIGLERQMLECSGFGFRNRHPQKLIIKLIKRYRFDEQSRSHFHHHHHHHYSDNEDIVMENTPDGNKQQEQQQDREYDSNINDKSVARLVYAMSLDLYRTYAPLKQTTPTMAFACLELTSRLCNLWSSPDNEFRDVIESGEAYDQWSITRAQVMETMLDLLELYTHHRNVTIVGPEFESELFLRCRIPLNRESEEKNISRFEFSAKRKRRRNSRERNNGVDSSNGYAYAGGSVEGTPRSVVTPNGTPGSTASRYANAVPNAMLVNPLMPRPAYDVPEKLPGGTVRDGTLRYVFDPDEAKAEKETVARYFDVEIEEYEAEE